MKLAAIVRCYCFTEYLYRVLKSLEYLDTIFLMNYRFEGFPESEDNTREIAHSTKQKNIQLYTGKLKKQHEIFNDGLELASDYDLVFINDADEFITKEDRDYMVRFIMDNPVDGGTCNVIDYMGNDKVAALRTHKPTVIVKPSVRFYDVRCAQYGNHYFNNVNMHHFGHMLKRKQYKESI